jgi:UDP-N-acetylmuramoyl-L-alanyl-D-glutamate--2,6-diaminopimelate ligase
LGKTNWNFNAYNALAIYGTAVELGMDSLETLRLLSELESVSGRFQYIVSSTNITALLIMLILLDTGKCFER